MAATPDNRKYSGDGSNQTRDQFGQSFNGPVKSGQIIKTGCLVGQLLSDTNNPPFLYDFVADGTMRCIGFATLGADLSTPANLPDNSRPVRVIAETGMLIDKNAGAANALAVTGLWAPVYGVDNQTCSALVSDSPGGVAIGVLAGIDKSTGNPVVLVDGPTAAQLTPFVGKAAATGHQARLVATANQAALTGLPTIDSVVMVAGDVLLLAAQTTAAQNGPYIVSAGAWIRAPWFSPQYGALADMTVEISEGTVWAHSTWKLMTQGVIVPGTTSIAFYPRQHKFTSAAMVGGTLALTALWIFSATGQIMATVNTVGGTVGPPHVNTRVAGPGTGTAVLNSTGADTSTVDIMIVNW